MTSSTSHGEILAVPVHFNTARCCPVAVELARGESRIAHPASELGARFALSSDLHGLNPRDVDRPDIDEPP